MELTTAPTLSLETIPTDQSLGRVVAQTITCPVDIPSFSNAAMDGYACRAQDTMSAKPTQPVLLPITGASAAGDSPGSGVTGAWAITTGAVVPPAYDCIIPHEAVTVIDNNLRLVAPVRSGIHVRDIGEDFTIGHTLARPGTRITPQHLMALAAAGIDQVPVFTQPRITVLSTGKELVEDSSTPLLPGQIRNSNGPFLLAALQQMSFGADYAGLINDEPQRFIKRVTQLLPHTDVIISTGAVSAGTHDFIPECLQLLGATIVFHKVAIRPGKPLIYARFEDGTHYLGLPGNPVSAAVGMRFFVSPLLRSILGRPQEQPLSASLIEGCAAKKEGLRCFYKARLDHCDGQLALHLLQGQESFKVQPLLCANCWAVIPESCTSVTANTQLDVYGLLPDTWQFHDDH